MTSPFHCVSTIAPAFLIYFWIHLPGPILFVIFPPSPILQLSFPFLLIFVLAHRLTPVSPWLDDQLPLWSLPPSFSAVHVRSQYQPGCCLVVLVILVHRMPLPLHVKWPLQGLNVTPAVGSTLFFDSGFIKYETRTPNCVLFGSPICSILWAAFVFVNICVLAQRYNDVAPIF